MDQLGIAFVALFAIVGFVAITSYAAIGLNCIADHRKNR